MGKLEPTRTYSNPTATEILRRMLDERGVEWTAPNSILRDTVTCWTAGGFYYEAFEVPEPDGTFLLTAAHQDDLTPEQAIAATLGDADATRARQPDALGPCNCTDGERTNGTCHDVHEPPRTTTFWPTPHFKCSECGEVHVSMQYVFYCPNCGRKVVE